MNEHIIAQHNSVVSSKDKWYCLGDVAMNKKFLPLLHRMNGEKVLIRGNHDTEPAKEYLKYFKDVRGCHQFDWFFLGHVPIHPDSLGRWGTMVHGHLHANRVMLPYSGTGLTGPIPDHRYYNVSLEQLDNYTPISLEELKLQIKNRLESSAKT